MLERIKSYLLSDDTPMEEAFFRFVLVPLDLYLLTVLCSKLAGMIPYLLTLL